MDLGTEFISSSVIAQPWDHLHPWLLLVLVLLWVWHAISGQIIDGVADDWIVFHHFFFLFMKFFAVN